MKKTRFILGNLRLHGGKGWIRNEGPLLFDLIQKRSVLLACHAHLRSAKTNYAVTRAKWKIRFVCPPILLGLLPWFTRFPRSLFTEVGCLIFTKVLMLHCVLLFHVPYAVVFVAYHKKKHFQAKKRRCSELVDKKMIPCQWEFKGSGKFVLMRLIEVALIIINGITVVPEII